jgi:HlyD family secretion protein
MNTKIGTLTLLLALLLGACSNSNEKADAYGNFEATEITISAEGNGRIEYLNLEEGQEFEKVQQVGLIDTIQLNLQKLQLKAQRKAVAAGIQGILSRIAVYEQQLVNLEKDRLRVEKMYKSGAATSKQKDDVEGKIDVVKREVRAVKTENAKVLANLEALDRQIERLEDQIQRQVVSVPQPGVILEKYVEPNEMVSRGKPLFKMADLSQMHLRVYVSGEQLPNLKIGQNVEVQIDQDAKENSLLKGSVSWIASQAEFTPKIIQTKKERVKLVYAVKILVKNDGRIKIGMPGELRFKKQVTSSK